MNIEQYLIKICFLCCWISYAILEGYRDSNFYHNRMTSNNPSPKNIHWVYFMQRLILGSIIYFGHNHVFSTLNSFVFCAGLILIFSYFHNGMYYLTRHELNNNLYPKGWDSDSISSEATLEFSYKIRTGLLLVGSLGIFTSIFDKL